MQAESTPPPERRVFTNRTLNFRSLKAIGYDMDYTLVHYDAEVWERAAFDQTTATLARQGLPVEHFRFEPERQIQGLVFDLELGNLVKASRFGYIIWAHHGASPLSYPEVRRAYAGTFVDLSEPRWKFTNTLFSLSEESLFAQMVELADAGKLPGVMGYADVYDLVITALDETHRAGELKVEIARRPDDYVEVDDQVGPTLAEQRAAGRKVFLITNSDWSYSNRMMTHSFGPHWRDLFDLVIVSAAKPAFFEAMNPFYRVVDTEQGLLRPHHGELRYGEVYFGGNAAEVESSFGLSGGDILYVGDHLFGDVHVSKATLRWRTALIMRELENEIADTAAFVDEQSQLDELMRQKDVGQATISQLRMRYLADPSAANAKAVEAARTDLVRIDREIAPLASAAARLGNPTWGPLMRAGVDKSLFARQVERYADVYTSRVSNLRAVTPYGYLRAGRSSLPHDEI